MLDDNVAAKYSLYGHKGKGKFGETRLFAAVRGKNINILARFSVVMFFNTLIGESSSSSLIISKKYELLLPLLL